MPDAKVHTKEWAEGESMRKLVQRVTQPFRVELNQG